MGEFSATETKESPMMQSVPKTTPSSRLRALINAPDILVLPGVFDGFSTRLVEKMGYTAAFITGSGVSESRLGQPDVGLMGLDENVAAARAIAACSNLLLLADADTGYGNPINVHHTVRAFERAGVAGLMLEDQVWPKRCGHLKGKEVISAEEMVQKIRAAADARVDPEFVIKSRTDVLATHGLAEAIRRLNLYAEAGADLLFADAAMSAEDIGTIARNVVKPLSVNMGFGIRQRSTTPLLSAKQLQDLGVAVVIYPRLLTACALQGMRHGLELLKQSLDSGKVVDRPDALVSFEELHDIMGMHDVEELEQRFLTPEQLETKYGSERKASIMPDAKPTNPGAKPKQTA
jgi:2-methylisocitrate lyase-like PEP mutase family enzyme